MQIYKNIDYAVNLWLCPNNYLKKYRLILQMLK